MKHLILTILLAAVCSATSAQSDKFVKWDFSSKKIADKTYEVHFKATIAGTYHIYSQEPGNDGPLPTKFIYHNNPQISIHNKPREAGKLINIYDDAWKGKVRYFEKIVDFIQVVKISGATTLTGKIEFMVSNHKEAQPPTELEFSVRLGDRS